MNCGGEVELNWRRKNMVFLNSKGKIVVCFRKQPDMTRYFDSVDKFLENKVGGDRLWDEIPKVMVTDRTI